jgi:hypothetical protein
MAGIVFLSACSEALVTGNEQANLEVESLDVGLAKKLPPGMSLETLTLELEEVEEAWSKKPDKGRRAYALDAAPPVWESSFGTGLLQEDDGCDLVGIGFPFTFYGTSYTEVWINQNGNVTFNACNDKYWAPDIPDGENVIIAPLYGDTKSDVDGDVYYNTLGTAPNRTFVVTWANQQEISGETPNTFQMQLSEGTNNILFGYNGLATDGVQWLFWIPATDADMDVGISSGTGLFVNSASGTDIPALDMTNICYVPDGGDYEEISGPCPSGVGLIEVNLDIKPGSFKNQVNTRSRGMVLVAILGTDAFDVTDLDMTSLTFGPDGATPVHDLSDPLKLSDHLQDLDSDGLTDLLMHYRQKETGLAKGDTEACVVGATLGGIPIEGCDSVRIVK